MIDEGLDPLVREVRADHRVEERAIFEIQEQVELVAGVLAVQRAPLGIVQRVPAGDERELAQVGVVAQRQEVGVRALDAVDQVDLGGRQIVDHQPVPRDERGDLLVLLDVAVRVERELKAQVAGRERRLGERDPPDLHAGRIVDDHGDRGRATERCHRDLDCAGRVRGEVGEYHGRRRQEVVAGERVLAAGGRLGPGRPTVSRGPRRGGSRRART